MAAEKLQTLSKAIQNIEKVRQSRQSRIKFNDKTITMSHGSGGTASRNMIEGMIIKIFSNTVLDKLEDSAILQIKDTKLRLAFLYLRKDLK